ncbi:MAG: hypothetical protein EXR75_06360 [Myxococcales bacterium]|nr:hypothetical protein [Myxococcales bacterium]
MLCGSCAFVGTGEGELHSELLVVRDCWGGPYDLAPDFFAAVPFRDTLQVRVQHGSDLQEVSDGLAVMIDGVTDIRADSLGTSLAVGLSPQVLEDIAPGIAKGEPPPVSMALYLQFSCHNQNAVLYAIDGTITFASLFSGDPNEDVGADKLTDATFDVRVADPRDALPGTLDVPSELTSRVTGNFKFHFRRGQPGQPFP